jgi:hypothetical protein
MSVSDFGVVLLVAWPAVTILLASYAAALVGRTDRGS